MSFSDHEPFRNGKKKTYQAFESLNSDVLSKALGKITILGQDEQETNAKNWAARNSASELTSPLEMVKKT